MVETFIVQNFVSFFFLVPLKYPKQDQEVAKVRLCDATSRIDYCIQLKTVIYTVIDITSFN